jgi:hypothetical protein
LEEQVVERTVFFPVFTRYFLARGRSFKIIVADLLKHREASQNERPPLILRADVPRLRHILHKRLGYLRDTYCLFKDTVSGNDRDKIGVNISLIKLHMKMCLKHYQALIPQLDLIATQWGGDIEDSLSHNNFDLLRSEGERQKRQGNLDEQLRNQVRETRKRLVREDVADPVVGPPLVARPPPGRPQQKSKTSATNSAETLERLTTRNKDEVRKRRETEGLLTKAEEDLRLLRRHLKSQPTVPGRQINHPREPPPVQGGSATSRQGSKVPASQSSTLSEVTTTASDVGIKLLQVLRDATASSSSGNFERNNTLFEEYPEGQTFRTFYHSLTTSWDVLPPDQGMVKE